MADRYNQTWENKKFEFNKQQEHYAIERNERYRKTILSSLENNTPCWDFEIEKVPYRPFFVNRAGQELFNGYIYTQKNFFVLNNDAKTEGCRAFLTLNDATRMNCKIRQTAKAHLISIFEEPTYNRNSYGIFYHKGGWEKNLDVFSIKDIYKVDPKSGKEIPFVEKPVSCETLCEHTRLKKTPIDRIITNNTHLADLYLVKNNIQKGEDESYSHAVYRMVKQVTENSDEANKTSEKSTRFLNDGEKEVTCHCAAARICLTFGLSYQSELPQQETARIAESLKSNPEIDYERIFINTQKVINSIHSNFTRLLSNQNLIEKMDTNILRMMDDQQNKSKDNQQSQSVSDSLTQENTMQSTRISVSQPETDNEFVR